MTYFSGYFNKGEIDTPITVHTAIQFKNVFGTANNDNYNDWYQAYNYLQYSGNLIVNRVCGVDVMNAFKGYPFDDVPTLILNEEDYTTKKPNIPFVTGNYMKFIAKTPGSWGNDLKVAVITLKEWLLNVDVWNGQRARDLIPGMQKNEYAVFIFRKDVVVEQFIKRWDTFSELSNDSKYVYSVENMKDPTQWIDGNWRWFDGVNPIGYDTIYDGNEPYFYVPIAYGPKIIDLSGGYENAPNDGQVLESYTKMESKEDYELNYIIGNERFTTAAIELAHLRKDCVAFIGMPTNAQNSTLTGFVSSLGTSEYTHLSGDIKRIMDGFTNSERWVNIAGDIAGIKAQADDNAQEWFASAGLSRGNIKGCLDIKLKHSKDTQDELYKNGVNIISNIGADYYMGSQKLLVSRPSSFDRVNVRVLFNKIERNITKVSRLGVFDENTLFARNKIQALIKPYLKNIKNERGIVNYKVTCSDDFVLNIYIQPNIVAEYIRLSVSNVGTNPIFEVSFAS